MPDDKPIKWAVPLMPGFGVVVGPWNGRFNGEFWETNNKAEPADTLTLRKLYGMVEKMPAPHPLSGIDIVYYAENMRDAARTFVDEYNKLPRFAAPIVAAPSPILPPGYILGRKGKGFVLIAGPEKEPTQTNGATD